MPQSFMAPHGVSRYHRPIPHLPSPQRLRLSYLRFFRSPLLDLWRLMTMASPISAALDPDVFAGVVCSPVPDEHCEEQGALATAVVDAINKVYVAKRDLDSAKTIKAETDRLMIALNYARAVERHTIAAFNQHKKEHGCKNNAV
jgi:hypothetical protein